MKDLLKGFVFKGFPDRFPEKMFTILIKKKKRFWNNLFQVTDEFGVRSFLTLEARCRKDLHKLAKEFMDGSGYTIVNIPDKDISINQLEIEYDPEYGFEEVVEKHRRWR